MDTKFARIFRLTLLIGTIIGLIRVSPTQAQTVSPTAGTLPDQRTEATARASSVRRGQLLYPIKKAVRTARSALTFRPVSKQKNQILLADASFSELLAHLQAGETQYLEPALADYQEKMARLAKMIEDQVANNQTPSPEVTALAGRVAGRLSIVAQIESVKGDRESAQYLIEAAQAPYPTLDVIRHLQGEKPIPPDALVMITEYHSMGFLTDSQKEAILSATTRAQARAIMKQLQNQEGVFNETNITQLYQEEMKERFTNADKAEAANLYTSYNSIQATPYLTNPPETLKTKIAEFLKSYTHGTAIPADIRPWVVSQIRGLRLSMELPDKLAKLDGADLRAEDQKILADMKQVFFEIFGGDLAATNDPGKARQAFTRIQELYAKRIEQDGPAVVLPTELAPGWTRDAWNQELTKMKERFDPETTGSTGQIARAFNPKDWAVVPQEQFFDRQKLERDFESNVVQYEDKQRPFTQSRKKLLDRYVDELDKLKPQESKRYRELIEQEKNQVTNKINQNDLKYLEFQNQEKLRQEGRKNEYQDAIKRQYQDEFKKQLQPNTPERQNPNQNYQLDASYQPATTQTPANAPAPTQKPAELNQSSQTQPAVPTNQPLLNQPTPSYSQPSYPSPSLYPGYGSGSNYKQ